MIGEADVVREALTLLERRGGFTPDGYLVAAGRDEQLDSPGESVVSMCAIGGVEQAIWRLTGRDDSPRRAFAPRRSLYGRVISRLNAKARDLYPTPGGGAEIGTVEQLTFYGSRSTARRRTLNVFRQVLNDLEREDS